MKILKSDYSKLIGLIDLQFWLLVGKGFPTTPPNYKKMVGFPESWRVENLDL